MKKHVRRVENGWPFYRVDFYKLKRQVLLSHLSTLTFTFTEDDEVNGPNLPATQILFSACKPIYW